MEPSNRLVDGLASRWRSLRESPQARRALAMVAVFSLILFWCYEPTLADMARRWSDDPKYSHGFLVPVFAAIVLWVRRREHPGVKLQLVWSGIAWLLIAGVMRLASAAFYFEWLDALSLLPALAGVCVLLGGSPALRWAWPSIAFLVFMMPAPYQLEVALAQPLQRVATASSTYLLQTVGLPAVAEGNIIWINEVPLGVVEACSGLGMLITFFALSTAVALVLTPSWPERFVLFVSAVPIAVLTNVARITVTGILYATVGGTVAKFVYHDLAGWLMMPLALVLLWLELRLLTHLFIEPKLEPPLPVGLAAGPVSVERKPARTAAPPPATPVGELGPL
jgi:exosortase